MRTPMKRTWPIWLLLFGATAAWATPHTVIVGGSTSDGGYGNTAVLMFNPPTLTIAVGDTVTFTNAGGGHNVDSDDGTSFRCASNCANDGHGGSGDPSDNLWSSTITFNQAGTFGYHCDVHGSMGMTGSITVTAATPPATVPITGAFSGAWYDPAQSGHGIIMEVLGGATPADNLLAAYWFTFTPDGTQQAWFGGIGPIVGGSAVVSANQTTGGRWIPNFDPATIVNNPWGTLTFSFTDCNHGRVDFASTIPGYASNHMDLVRLTQPIGATCQ
ncbi:MAG: plastocyanin/azurin family copper-binding protein [Dokdonella sp.]